MKKPLRRMAALAIACLVLVASSEALQPSRSRPRKVMNAAELRLALERLNVLGSALYVAAHPDDENTAMIAWLSNGRLVRTGYMAMTRGDGGQNLIGSEKGDTLGVIRTEELLAARQIDGGEQFFARAIDFGYSKSPEEALSVWGHDEILSDVVRVIREFRPDVIITRFPADGTQTHGHHTASAILANEAFRAAGDPTRFPEQLGEVQPWQPKRIFWDSWLPRQPNPPADLEYLNAPIGDYSRQLGLSYTELAGMSRSMHKSQGFGAAERRGSLDNHLVSTGGDPASNDPFDGIDMTWSRVEGGARIEAIIDRAIAAFDVDRPEKIVPVLLEAGDAIDGLPDSYWKRVKKAELLDVIRSATGLWIESIAEAPSVVPGATAKIRVSVLNRTAFPMRMVRVAPRFGDPIEHETILSFNQPVLEAIEVPVPDDAPLSQPYWLRESSKPGRFVVRDASMIGRPENPPALPVEVTIEADGRRLVFEVPTLYRWTDDVEGETYRPVEVVPAATIDFSAPLQIFPDHSAKKVGVAIRSAVESLEGRLRLEAPDGWKVEPESVAISMTGIGSEKTVEFEVFPPSGESNGTLRAVVEAGSRMLDRSRTTVGYWHIPHQTLFPPATLVVTRADIRASGGTVGYVMGSGDDVPEALRQLGFDVAELSDPELTVDFLKRFPVVVLGIRAFNTREVLERRAAELQAYVEGGGRLVVQYNTSGRGGSDGHGPYPFRIGRDRVTVEEAPVEILLQDHSLMTRPNKITSRDFDGWVQERGLYFASEWDPSYVTLLAMNDPGEDPSKGSLIIAKYGKGEFIYTGLSFFRQLPAGVPGAYRLFANLVSIED